MKKYLRYFLLILIIVIIIAPIIIIGPFYSRVDHFEPNLSEGYFADFFLYLSPAAKRNAIDGNPITILVQPNNSGINSDDREVHKKDAWWMCFGRHKIADELGVVLLVPAFIRPQEDWHIYTHALDRDVFTTKRKDLYRLDLQLLEMVEAAKSLYKEKGWGIDEKILIQGFSASGMFANRFATLHSSKIKAVATGSPGGWPIAPIAEYKGDTLFYPAGIADVQELTGKSFDEEAYKLMPQLIVMGSLDDNDAVDFTDGWDKEHAAIIENNFGTTPISRWQVSESLYNLVSENTRFKLVEGVGHDRRNLQNLSTAFFKEILAQE